jgi:hypothetical protein
MGQEWAIAGARQGVCGRAKILTGKDYFAAERAAKRYQKFFLKSSYPEPCEGKGALLDGEFRAKRG